MFVIECDCGYEIYVSSGDDSTAWQCAQCGKWLNFFGQEVPAPRMQPQTKPFADYDPDFYDDDEA